MFYQTPWEYYIPHSNSNVSCWAVYTMRADFISVPSWQITILMHSAQSYVPCPLFICRPSVPWQQAPPSHQTTHSLTTHPHSPIPSNSTANQMLGLRPHLLFNRVPTPRLPREHLGRCMVTILKMSGATTEECVWRVCRESVWTCGRVERV